MIRVRVTCPDCTGIDFFGCGDGSPWFLDGEFETVEEAQAAADEDGRDTIYEYEIVVEP